MKSSFAEKWRRFWFEPVAPTGLDICRIIFFGVVFIYFLRRDFSAWGGVSLALWKPIWLFERLHLPIFSPTVLMILEVIWKASLVFSCIGLLTRVSTCVAFVLGSYLLLLPTNFGQQYREELIVIITFGIMAASRAGASLSVDRLLQRKPYQALASGEYTWPLRAVWLTMSLIYFAAGVAKLRHSGLSWTTSDTLSIYLVRLYYNAEQLPLLSWGLHLAEQRWLCNALAAATLLWEITFPLAMFSRIARWILLPISLSMLAGIRLFMGPPFELLALCYVFWIPWGRMVGGAALPSRRRPAKSQPEEFA